MSAKSGLNAPPKIDLGESEIRLGPGRAGVLVLSVVLLIAAVCYSVISAGSEKANCSAIAGAIMVVAPLIIGILVSPERKPADYSDVAVQAISELDELRRGNRALVDELLRVDMRQDGADAQLVIAKSAEEMDRQYERLGRGVGHWFKVSPDVVKRFTQGEARNQEMLLEMEQARSGEELRDG